MDRRPPANLPETPLAGFFPPVHPYPLGWRENVSMASGSGQAGGIAHAGLPGVRCAESGPLNLIHRTKPSNPATARVPGRLALAFRGPCGVWRVVDADAFFVLPGATRTGGYSTDRKDAYATR